MILFYKRQLDYFVSINGMRKTSELAYKSSIDCCHRFDSAIRDSTRLSVTAALQTNATAYSTVCKNAEAHRNPNFRISGPNFRLLELSCRLGFAKLQIIE